MSEGADEVSGGRRPLGDLAEALATDGRWAPWPAPVVLRTTPSTMTEVAYLAEEGAPEGTAVVAEEQTAGRGRVGRTWESPPFAGLWLSVLVHVPPSASMLGWLPLVTGSAVAAALRTQTHIDLRLKWPNDIVVESPDGLLKVGGILAERLPGGAVVVGIGINVDQTVDELPDGGTSLRALGSSETREALLVAVLGGLAESFRAWAAGSDPGPIYRSLCVTLGSRVRVEGISGVLTGTASGLGVHGELLVVDEAGAEHAVSAGDVLLVRPPSA